VNPNRQATPLTLPADKVTQGDIPLGLMCHGEPVAHNIEYDMNSHCELTGFCRFVRPIMRDIRHDMIQTSLRSRLSRMPHGRHIKEEIKEIRIGKFSLDGSSHQTGDAAFTPAKPHDLHHSRANNDSHNSHNTQHTRVIQNTLCFTQKNTQPSQTCSGGQITQNPTPNRCG
jgi:hypothetical protein